MQALTRSDTRELRAFGLGLAALVAVVFWLVIPWLREKLPSTRSLPAKSRSVISALETSRQVPFSQTWPPAPL